MEEMKATERIGDMEALVRRLFELENNAYEIRDAFEGMGDIGPFLSDLEKQGEKELSDTLWELASGLDDRAADLAERLNEMWEIADGELRRMRAVEETEFEAALAAAGRSREQYRGH